MIILFNIFLYLIYAIISSIGLYYIKITHVGLNSFFILGSILYGLGFLIWLVVLKSNHLSVAFPIASSMILIATQFVGYFLLNEGMSVTKLLGLLFIIIGISFLSYNELSSIFK